MSTPEHDGFVHVRGAREHNLRDVDVDLPRDAIVAFSRLDSVVMVPTLERELGAPRRCWSATAGGSPLISSTCGAPTCWSRRRRLRILFARAGTYPAGAEHLAAEAFSPNTAAGACPTCHGLGVTHDVTEDLLVPDDSLSIRDGAIAAWPGAWQGHNLRRIVKNLGIDVDTPWRELATDDRRWLLFTDEQPAVLIRPQDKDGGGGRDYMGTFRSGRARPVRPAGPDRGAGSGRLRSAGRGRGGRRVRPRRRGTPSARAPRTSTGRG